MSIIDSIITHSPALIVAIPLLGAFLTPLISKINDKLRNIFAIFIVINIHKAITFITQISHWDASIQYKFNLVFLDLLHGLAYI